MGDGNVPVCVCGGEVKRDMQLLHVICLRGDRLCGSTQDIDTLKNMESGIKIWQEHIS